MRLVSLRLQEEQCFFLDTLPEGTKSQWIRTAIDEKRKAMGLDKEEALHYLEGLEIQQKNTQRAINELRGILRIGFCLECGASSKNQIALDKKGFYTCRKCGAVWKE